MALYSIYTTGPRRRYSPEDELALFERSYTPQPYTFPSLQPFFNDFGKFDVRDIVEKQPTVGKDGFQVSMDVQHFQPNEITVKTENNQVVVNAKHEEKRDDHGYISREFTRRYVLPEGFKSEDVTSTLSSDGVLTVKAPRRDPTKGDNVRQIQIQQTGPARLNVATNKDEKADDQTNGKSKK